jgi:hypothetical protein
MKIGNTFFLNYELKITKGQICYASKNNYELPCPTKRLQAGNYELKITPPDLLSHHKGGDVVGLGIMKGQKRNIPLPSYKQKSLV